MRVLDRLAIKDARYLRHLSQQELGRRCDRSRSAVAQVENGPLEVIERAFALDLARELGLDWERVFAYTEPVAVPKVETTVHPTHKASA